MRTRYWCILAAVAALLTPPAAHAQPGAAQTAQAPVAVPGFWDPRRRPERPDTSRISQIRFLTEFDYPPFNYAGPDGNPAGFNVELARLICEELKLQCTIQLRRFDTLLQALGENRADAVIASLAVTPETRLRVDFSDPYYRATARFVARRDFDAARRRAGGDRGQKIAVLPRTAHEQYLKAFFTEAEPKTYPTMEAARDALRKGEVDLVFGDGIALAFWLNGTDWPTAASSSAARSPRAAISARASASRCAAATTPCGSRSTGRCSGCGRRAASPTCGCGIFRSARFERQDASQRCYDPQHSICKAAWFSVRPK